MKSLIAASALAFALGTGAAFAQGGAPSNPTPNSPPAKNQPGKADGGGFGEAGKGGAGTTSDSARGRVGPTKADCDAGWKSSMAWTQSEFRVACDKK